MAGPLAGLRIVEFAGIGPGPFAAMMLADHGAEVIRIERPGAAANPMDPLLRSRRSVVLDLKSHDDRESVRDLCRSADGVIEGFRPGVMERLGLGPDVLRADNPKLVYGRMTGWGQHGPLSAAAGHDINYIALSGVLAACGREGEKPTPPINLAGDFGGGAMMLAFGMVAALLHVRMGGQGQVIDCAMTDGSALLMAMMWGFRAQGQWRDIRGVNLLDTGAPFYDTYETADGGHVALGAIEPQFYAEFRARAGIADRKDFDSQDDPSRWPEQKAALAEIFRTRTRAEWSAVMEGSDACCLSVLGFAEAVQHPHNLARDVFIDVGGVVQPAPAPRYSATPCARPTPPPPPGADQSLLQALPEPVRS
ncbi:CaiB/BaiF CoA transferase family protein [Brevundimonas vesicularis]|uniref:CoA transferase n=1 Tax=Brevundimonas vesicularis TaxID=41276 RepID=A0ABU4KRW7_BREVE|nr:CaiB/BaiF CoA-transferase family protein [Brevundimonas vesicularis]MDX2335753.1 CoA transferase [Brevundimonas vesicularis]